MHVEGQQIIALGIVAVAAAAVGRRLWAQVAAFRAPRRRAGPTAPAARPPASAPPPLIQIQRKPPVHMKRPPADGS